MNKRYIFLLGAALICGCTSQENLETESPLRSNKSFAVTVEDVVSNPTRAHLDGLKVVLDNEDKIAVFDNNTAASEYTYSASEEKFAGTSIQTGDPLDGVFALHPYSASVEYIDGKFEASLPAVQKYEVNSFSKNSHIMFGTTDNMENGITLKNMGGYIKLQLYSPNETIITKIKLSTLEEDQVIAGDFYISRGDGEEYALTMYPSDQTTHTSQASYVTLDCSEQAEGGVVLGNSNNPTTFYIAVPAQTYTKGFKITATDIFGREFTKTASAEFTLERNHIKPMEALAIDYSADKYIQIAKDGDYYYVTPRPQHSLEDFMKWAYIVNNINNSLGIKLVGDVTLPQKEIAVDEENQTYVHTDTDITIDANGVPSGSNWVPLGTHIGSEDLSKAFKGNIDGQSNIEGGNWVIDGICINQTGVTGVGFISEFADGSIKNLIFRNSHVYSNGNRAACVVGDNRYNTIIENVHVEKSKISGTNYAGGIVGMLYRRRQNAGQTHERLSYIINCSTDNETSITGTGSEIGGICGYNYGAAIIGCTNSADVTGQTHVGGIAGMNRTYTTNGVNGYTIACVSTSDATITATDGAAGGIVGDLFRDRGNPGHNGSEAYVVACYSLSTTVANYAGALIGYGHEGHYGSLIASFANNSTLVGQNGSVLLEKGTTASAYYSESTDITTEKISEMNAAIDEYNANVTDMETDAINKIRCHYKWQHNADGWPILVKDTQN